MTAKPRLAPEPAPVEGARWIPLTKEKFALVDDAGYVNTFQYNWMYHPAGYAYRQVCHLGKKTNIYLHQQILNVWSPHRIDHRNGDGLDNRKHNLRRCTPGQNSCNQRIHRRPGKTSVYKGVSWHKSKLCWVAGIKVNGRRLNLGEFSEEILAAKAYDTAARKYHGEFARTNFQNDNLLSAGENHGA